MRLLHLIQRYWPVRGGAERHLQAVGERLVRDGHRVTVATTNVRDIAGFAQRQHTTIPERESVHAGVRVVRFPIRQPPFPDQTVRATRRLMAEFSRRGWGSDAWLRRLADFALGAPQLHQWIATQHNQFDLVAAMGIGYESLYYPALDFARREHIPFLFFPLTHLGETSHLSPPGRGAGGEGRPTLKDYYTMRHQLALLRASDVVFAQTPLEVEFLTEVGVAPQRIVLPGVGVEPSDVTGGDAQRFRQLLGTNAPIVLALGTQTADKGTLHLIAAMQTLWAAGSGAHLALVGTAMREVKQALDALPVSVRVHTHLLGSVSDETKRDAFAACALLALPSRTDSFGIVLLEAWLNTKPVVGARAGGIPAIIDDGCDGLLVPFGDVPALADAIQQLLNNETLRAAFGQAGRAKTLAHYTWDTIYPVIRETYERFDTSRVLARGTYNG